MSDQTRDNITAAVMAHLEAEGMAEPGDMPGDWALIMHVPNLQADPEDRDAYFTCYSQHVMPGHITVGLWAKGLARAQGHGG